MNLHFIQEYFIHYWRQISTYYLSPSPALAPHLLFEIVEQIVIHLLTLCGRDGTPNHRNPNLISCSLVSRAWVGPVRKHMWSDRNSWFHVPSTNGSLQQLQKLLSSPFCTLTFGAIWFDPRDYLILELVPQVVVRDAKHLRISPASNHRHVLSNRAMDVLGGIQTITSVDLVGVHLESAAHFLDFIERFPGVKSLSCSRIHLNSKETSDKAVALAVNGLVFERLCSLEVDVEAYSDLFLGRVGFPQLVELELQDYYRHGQGEDQSRDVDRLRQIGNILAHAGKHLERLVLWFPSRTDPCPEIGEFFNLPKMTPLLRTLVVCVGRESIDLILPMLSFSMPHPHLSVLRIPAMPSNQKALDATLARAIPRLQSLQFPSVHKLTSKDVGNSLLFVNLDDVVKGGHAWRKMKQTINKLEKNMAWCKERGCLHPTFLVGYNISVSSWMLGSY
ncbi:hypothetical protein Moror_13473 [Moniliophthora roreri MCA 2997]|uniref:F-box domain-containing protein n=1 Tax=Moniliophthora roreri (strain MCA 2997) TaxID=1381753 RepID=V2WK71_MONRO|nr:hypothetical protein Moror_13473 [Moniliophthora roreri MCA 2997]